MRLHNGTEIASKGGFMERKSGAVLRRQYHVWLFMGIYLVVIGLALLGLAFYREQQYQQSLGSMYSYVKYKQSYVEPTLPFTGFLMVFALLFFVGAFIWHRKMVKAFDEEREAYDKIRGFTDGCLSAGDFLAHRGTLRQSDFTGVYVLHNLAKDMYYVGQSVKVVDRVGQHFTGRGNADVYADFKYGDEFEISTVSLADSGYGSLNDLESDTIAAYDAYNSGYNKTAGNSR